VRGFIEAEILLFHSVGQCQRLMETEAQTFSRNGIDRARRIADQRDIPARHAPQLTRSSERSPFHGTRHRVLEPG